MPACSRGVPRGWPRAGLSQGSVSDDSSPFLGGGLSKEKLPEHRLPRAFSRVLIQAFAPSGGSPLGPGRLGDSRTVVPTGFAQALPFALCPQAERVLLQARARAQTGHQPEPGPAADRAHVSD